MTNKDNFINLDSEKVYDIMKSLVYSKSKEEVVAWLNTEYTDGIVHKNIHANPNQICPHCGNPWVWSHKRWCEAFDKGYLTLTCKRCGKKFRAWTKE
ncbi:hypothetical protein IKN40_02620 [bacterium]|nr:hypothetical protein [bacterium]